MAAQASALFRSANPFLHKHQRYQFEFAKEQLQFRIFFVVCAIEKEPTRFQLSCEHLDLQCLRRDLRLIQTKCCYLNYLKESPWIREVAFYILQLLDWVTWITMIQQQMPAYSPTLEEEEIKFLHKNVIKIM